MPIPLLPTSSSQRHENAGARCWGEINHSEQLTAALIQRNAQPGKTFLHSPRDTTCIHCLALPQSCIQQLFISNSSSHVFKEKRGERDRRAAPPCPRASCGSPVWKFPTNLEEKGLKTRGSQAGGANHQPQCPCRGSPVEGDRSEPERCGVNEGHS